MSHENSITIQRGDGKWINVVGDTPAFSKRPSVGLDKVKLRRKRPPLDGVYPTMRKAVEAAKKRSKEYRGPHVPPRPRPTIAEGN